MTAKAIDLMNGWIVGVIVFTDDCIEKVIGLTPGLIAGETASMLAWIEKVTGSMSVWIEKATVSKQDMIERRSGHGKTATKPWLTDWSAKVIE